ncbi:uncharacterized protein N0V89_009004 [Didymosphaeria variabile]|uniref:Transcription factor domain-containing protein n=1 Tax=Didymosphaeria variabile TaxID=1932322 RepID=A0A9W8XHI5_9PLEO|nr:uncharacterized protein N0V89_009004 [Didymosphaeria variabile]KAJ4350383.1 hypothetical protein N0V89_009004 [Didymosphaeria variabile]
MLQLCVAMLQDLGFCKNPQNAKKKITMGGVGANLYSVLSLAEKRAFLGTFYLAANFAQSWRRPTTLTHTRYMDQCCQHLADCQEYSTDAIITPLIQLGALLCRVHNYFSYDDIENADVKGEALVHLSVANFDRELDRITESIPQALIQSNPAVITATRLKTLYRCLNAVQSYIKTVLAVLDTSLHHLGFPSWSAWCYACIIACKLVFLTDEREQQTEINETFVEVLRLVMDKSLFYEPIPCSLPVEVIPSTWNPISVAREGEVLSLFYQMYNKMKFSLPQDPNRLPYDHCKTDPLSRIAYFQRNLLCSFTKRLNEQIPKLVGPDDNNSSVRETNAVALRENWAAPRTDYTKQRQERVRMPLLQNLHFNSMNFDSIAPPEDSMLHDGTFEDWLWNTAMDDFAMPPP